MSLKETVNLPQTDFPIRAGLQELEPRWLAQWEKEDTYQKSQNQSHSKSFTLHDGPPYPNGNIHLGHALNKVIKDIIVRYKKGTGHQSTFVPGWDCHGLPIETQVLKKLKETGEENKKHDIPWFRAQCEQFAKDYVETQKADFKRLGIWAQWDKPYLTLNPQYESKVVSQLGKLSENGLVFRGKKPIHWCMHCETALAEAEIEYADHRSPSIYVAFKLTHSPILTTDTKELPSLVVWTTTPWTLPANVAVAYHPEFEYALVQTEKGLFVGIASQVDRWADAIGLTQKIILKTFKGSELEKNTIKHPFIDREAPLVAATYITEEDGTGFVHIAPGHGQDDYLVGLKYDLPTIMPVDNKGRFTKEVEWEGQSIFDANKAIGQRMEELGTLLKLSFIKHSYPHCWRCKNPVIFRATPQWFIALDQPMTTSGKTLRETALAQIKATEWFPDWGEKRINAMIENRPDWCISRQRFWGIPITAFICTHCDHAELGGEFNKAIEEKIAKEGTKIWFEQDAKTLLPDHLCCSKCGKKEFKKEKDILDVWFESGASAGAVLNTEALQNPADLYLEGSDQHRGWFQSSLLIGCGTTGKAPYKSVLTHGFLVDEKGRKMSKSIGNVIAPEKILKNYGADVLRWWVASSDFKNDLAISDNILKQASDSFGKVRNTIRFCLSNLYDFSEKENSLPYEKLGILDQWALSELNNLIKNTHKNYNTYNFHPITQEIHHFCAVTLSAMYLDMIKDRLYCNQANDIQRRSAQTVLHHIAATVIKLISPILVFTAEEAFQTLNKNNSKSIHLTQLPETNPLWENKNIQKIFKELLLVRDEVYKSLEKLRTDKSIKSFLEAEIELPTSLEGLPEEEWATFLMVAKATHNKAHATLLVKKTSEEKCERCWRHLPLTQEKICKRCETALTSRS